MFHKRIIERHVRLSANRAALLGRGVKGAADAGDVALQVSYIDGRLAELEWVYEQALGSPIPVEG